MNNILILIPDKLRKPMGGMGEQARNLLASFPKDYRFNIIGSADEEQYTEDNYTFYPVMDIKTMNGNPDPICNTFLNQSLFIEKGMSLDIKPDIVHAFDWSTMWAGRILAKHYNVPLVTTVQLSIAKHITDIHPLQSMQHQMACSIEMSGLIESNAIVQVSESYMNLFPSFLKSKTIVIHNGINLNEWIKKDDVVFPGINKTKLVYIGRYAEMKNIQSLLDAKIPNDIDLIFIGNSKGGSEDLFQAMIKYCKDTPNAYYVGEKFGQEKIDWLMSADAVIVPSIHEPFGIVALEALASKSILLSSFVNGMGDFLNEDSAINCGITSESISKAINNFLILYENDKQRMIDNGINICDSHSWVKMAQSLQLVYNEIIKLNND